MKTLKEFFSELDNTNSNVGVSLSEAGAHLDEYAVEPKNKEDKEAKLKALQALLVDPNTAKDPQMKQAIQARIAQLSEDSWLNEDYKGWTYSKEVEEYDDVRKIFHSAKKDGKEVSMDWSPYNTPSAEDFKLWVDLGMPTRDAVNGIGPLDKDDLMTLAKTKQGTHAILQREDKEIAELKRLSGMAEKQDQEDVLGKLDAKTRMQLQKAKQKYAGLAKGDPLASLIMDLEKDISRLDQENDIEDAQIAAQDVVDKMHTDSINKLKKLK